MSIKRTFDLLQRYNQQFTKKKDAFGIKQNGRWKTYSSKEYIDLSYQISYGLLSLGLQKGDKIITISNNRPEWNFVDMGMAMIGVIHVPLFTSLSATEYEFIIDHSEAKMIFVSDKDLYNKIIYAANNKNLNEKIYSFDRIDNVKAWIEITELGKKETNQFQDKVKKIKESINENDFATLIYTSGTTGTSKGVMLSHKNLVHNFLAAADVFKLTENDKYLSILPLCHVGGRMGNYQTQYSGASLFYADRKSVV